MSLSLSDNSRECDGRAMAGEWLKDAFGVSLVTKTYSISKIRTFQCKCGVFKLDLYFCNYLTLEPQCCDPIRSKLL